MAVQSVGNLEIEAVMPLEQVRHDDLGSAMHNPYAFFVVHQGYGEFRVVNQIDVVLDRVNGGAACRCSLTIRP